nr:hypothetical protein [Tanacetum cinerariifolium]
RLPHCLLDRVQSSGSVVSPDSNK